jgi:hypothetical protein
MFTAKAQEDVYIVYIAYMLLALYLYFLSSANLEKLSTDFEELKRVVFGEIAITYLSAIGTMPILDHILESKQKRHIQHMFFIIAYIDADIYTAMPFFSAYFAAKRLGDCAMTVVTCGIPFMHFLSSISRPKWLR